MKEVYKDYLFEKHILISEGMSEEKHVFETLFAMAHFFGVKITKGRELVHYGMVKELSKKIWRKCSRTILQMISAECPKSFCRGIII